MGKATLAILAVSLLLTIGSLATWGGTGRHVYTKFEVIEQVPAQADPDDPFAGTGFLDGGAPALETVRRDEFHLGIFPTPQGVFDKHAVSVLTIAVPPWALFGVLALLRRRSRRQSEKSGEPS